MGLEISLSAASLGRRDIGGATWPGDHEPLFCDTIRENPRNPRIIQSI